MNRTHTFRRIALAIILTITLFTAAQAGELSAPVGHLLGSHNETPSLAVADFNRDGKLDVVKAGVELNLAFGNGAGGFTNSTTQIFGGYSPRSVIAPDLNADGNADLVMLTLETSTAYYRVVWVMLGNGNGTFQPRQIYNLREPGHADRVQIADLDTDGRRDDIVITGYLQQLPETMIGKNDGTFNPAVRTSSTTRLNHNSAFGDFNSDGKTDMAVSHELNGRGFPMWLTGNGDGTFSYPISMLPFQDENRYEVPVAGDFNSDGKTDVAFFCDEVALKIFYSRGDGAFDVATALAVTDVSFSTETRAADMDGNGLLDIVLITAVTINDTPASSIVVFTNHASGWTKKVYSPDAGDLVGTLALRDFTNDGKTDILYAPGDYGQGGSQPHFSHRIRLMKNAASTTTTALSSTVPSNTTTQGDPVTFSAAISSASQRTFGKPFGAITFKVNGTPLCAMFPNANGGGTCGTAELPVGTHQITVTFDGDVSFAASNSNTITHTVNARPQVPTTTTITSTDADNRTNLGEAVIFTARVSANSGGTPTGNVIFKDNGTAWCAKPLVNGAVNCGTTELTNGTHHMTVEYQGGTGFAASTSPALLHSVGSQTFILSAIADAYVKGATPESNFGSAVELQVKRTLNPGSGKGRQAYLRFDTSGVQGTIQSAKLRVFGRLNAVNTNIPLGVFPVSNSAWTENGLTWTNKPAPNAPNTLAQVTVTDTTARWYELDITAFIQQERSVGRAVTGILLRNMTAGANGDYYTALNSREAGANQPQLVIVK